MHTEKERTGHAQADTLRNKGPRRAQDRGSPTHEGARSDRPLGKPGAADQGAPLGSPMAPEGKRSTQGSLPQQPHREQQRTKHQDRLAASMQGSGICTRRGPVGTRIQKRNKNTQNSNYNLNKK
jgi:hypothetical protein